MAVGSMLRPQWSLDSEDKGVANCDTLGGIVSSGDRNTDHIISWWGRHRLCYSASKKNVTSSVLFTLYWKGWLLPGTSTAKTRMPSRFATPSVENRNLWSSTSRASTPWSSPRSCRSDQRGQEHWSQLVTALCYSATVLQFKIRLSNRQK